MIVCHPEPDGDDPIENLVVVHRSGGETGPLLAQRLAPGTRLRDIGQWLVDGIAAVARRGVHGSVEPPDGQAVVHVVSLGEWIVLQIEHPGAADERAHWFQALVESTTDVIQVIDADGVTRYVTPQAESVLGLPPEHILGRNVRNLVDSSQLENLEAALAEVRSAAPGHIVEGEFPVWHGDEVRWARFRAANHLDNPELEAIVVTWHDVTEPHEIGSRLQYAATHDLLTGAANRVVFADHLQVALAAATRRPNANVAVLFCDLDRFKEINDRYGHAVGDDLLRQVAHRLMESVRPSDTVARLGGDEFAIVCDGLPDHDEAYLLATRALEAVSGHYRLTDVTEDVEIGMSVGVAVSGSGRRRDDHAQLLRRADAALYESKHRGRGQVVMARERGRRRRKLERELETAIEEGQLRLLYQPIVDLDSGATIRAEALVRWEHPTRGLLAPDAFLPLAEECGLLVPIGAWVLDEAVRQAASWGVGGVSVNLSGPELYRAGLADDVEAVLARHGLPGDALTVEVTEHVAVARPEALATLGHLRELGVCVALDAFGSGPASITTLRTLPLDVVKLDRSLVTQLDPASPGGALVSTIAELCRAVGLTATAQGIETAEQRHLLAGQGCEHGQGYYLGRPMSAAELDRIDLRERQVDLREATSPGDGTGAGTSSRGGRPHRRSG